MSQPVVWHDHGDGPVMAPASPAQNQEPAAVPDAAPDTGTCDPKYWSCPGAAGNKVRGLTYLKDKKKVVADEPVFGLASVDLVETEGPTWHIAQHLPAIRNSKAPFTFVVQLMVPGPPFLSLVMAWAADYDPYEPAKVDTPIRHAEGSPASSSRADPDSEPELTQSPFDVCLASIDRHLAYPHCSTTGDSLHTAHLGHASESQSIVLEYLSSRFLAGDDKEAEQRRNSMFKLIPSIVKGSWVIKQAVGSTPVLLGRKLTTKFFRGPGHFEVDVDVGSSRTAASVVGLVSPVTTSLIVDMAIVLEGREEQELPEQLLGTVRFAQVDMKSAAWLDTNTGKVFPKGT